MQEFQIGTPVCGYEFKGYKSVVSVGTSKIEDFKEIKTEVSLWKETMLYTLIDYHMLYSCLWMISEGIRYIFLAEINIKLLLWKCEILISKLFK